MPLSAGARLGAYQILSIIGAGGMGEVYRARDVRLDRDVALKILPPEFSTDPNRLSRFEQEARAAAALNHPNILAVLDIGLEAGTPFIVSELLVGQTLRERLLTGSVPVRKAIAYAVAIARGLAAAHEKGIIHRDLKPENVFVTTDDRVKILDFGLAKLAGREKTPSGASALLTVAAPTEPGVVLGTVGYMAPEQVRGLTVDHRADLFALGAILYELITGARAFRRDSAPETMTAILNDDPPDLRATERPIDTGLVRIVERCLEKIPTARFQTAADLGFALDALADSADSSKRGPVDRAAPTPSRTWLPWGAAVLLLVVLAPLTVQHLRERRATLGPIRFQIAPSVESPGPGNFALSPDGRHLALFGQGSDGVQRLWIRTMDSLELRLLPGSDVFGPTPPPFWSPDSRFVAFDVGGKLKRIEASGGPPQTVCDLPGVAVGGSWNRDGDIILGNTAGGLLRVRDTGGPPTELTVLDRSRKEEFHLLPTFLPDGRHFLYLRVSPSSPQTSGTYVGSLDTKPGEQPVERLLPYEVGMTYAPDSESGPGRLLFLHEGTLLAQPFDPRRRALAGPPVPVAERVGSFRDGGFFSSSANDMLVYRTADADVRLAWFDREGKMADRASEAGRFREVALSPDGSRAVVSRIDSDDMAKADLWLLDLTRNSGAARFTFGGGVAQFPVWSRDGARVAFTFNNNIVLQKLATGEGDEKELLRSNSSSGVAATDWSPDGRFLLYRAFTTTATRLDLWVLPPDGSTPVPFVRTAFDDDEGRFSPDGRWVAYTSNQSGSNEIYIRAVASNFSGGSAGIGGSTLVSRGGGTAPRWRGDGRELFYLAPDGKMMAVAITSTPDVKPGTPTPLFQAPPGAVAGDVTRDGQRFLILTPVGSRASAPFTVVLNWSATLKK